MAARASVDGSTSRRRLSYWSSVMYWNDSIALARDEDEHSRDNGRQDDHSQENPPERRTLCGYCLHSQKPYQVPRTVAVRRNAENRQPRKDAQLRFDASEARES